jgi:hypothetical protein
MKTSLRTITIITIVILIISGLSFAGGFSTTVTATAPDTYELTESSVSEPNNVYRPRIYNARTGTRSTAVAIPERPVKLQNESDEAYQNRLRSWEADLRRLTEAGRGDVSTSTSRVISVPERPVRREGESDAAYQNRLRTWEEVPRPVAATLPNQPARREGESDVAYQARIRKEEAMRYDLLQQDLQKLGGSTRSIWRFGSSPDNVLIIPTEEMKTEDVITINEDMKVMSQIFINELLENKIFASNYGSIPFGATASTGRIVLGTSLATPINSMYLGKYGVLFLINVDFPLSPPSEAAEQPQEPNKAGVDQVWQQTRKQIYQPGPTTVTTRQPYDDQEVSYDAQKVENLKNVLLQSLKHAANIRALKPDEAVILRITGIGQPVKVIAVTKQDNQTLVVYELNGVRQTSVISTDLGDFTRSLSSPKALVIRARKSDIDSFAKGELDFTKFNEKVKIFSYPIISGNSGEPRYFGF